MAEQERPKDGYFYTYSLSASGGEPPPADDLEGPTPEVLTDVVVETTPTEIRERGLASLRGVLKFPLRAAVYSGLKWKLRAVAGWTVMVGAAAAYQLTHTGQLLSLQAGELAVVWVGLSLPILMVPYSRPNQTFDAES